MSEATNASRFLRRLSFSDARRECTPWPDTGNMLVSKADVIEENDGNRDLEWVGVIVPEADVELPLRDRRPKIFDLIVCGGRFCTHEHRLVGTDR